MPVYNAASYLKESIDSILSQSYTNLEILLLNDGSTDGSSDMIEAAAKADKRVLSLGGTINYGLVTQLNNGIQAAKGKYIARMDADDIAPKERITLQVAFLEAHPEVGLCGGAVRMFGAGVDQVVVLPEKDNDIKQTLFLQNPFFHPAVTLRRSIINHHQLYYSESYMTAEDYHLWCEMSKVTSLHNLKEIMLHYRIHPGQVTRVQDTRGQQVTARIRREQMQLMGIKFEADEEEGFELLNSDRKYRFFKLEDYKKVQKCIKSIYLQTSGSTIISNMLDEQWLRVLQAAGKYKIRFLPVVMRNPLGRPLSTANFVLIVKCLTGWRPHLPAIFKRYWRMRLR